MVGRAVTDLQPAQVVPVHTLQRRLQLLARGFAAGAAQGFDQHLGGGKTFEHGRAGAGQPFGAGGVFHFLDYRIRLGLREHLADDDTPGVALQAGHKTRRGVVGQGHKLRGTARRPQRLDGGHRMAAGRDQQHRLRTRLHHLGHDGREIRLGAVEFVDAYGLQLGFLQAFLGPGQAVFTKTVVGVDDGDFGHADAGLVHQGFFGFTLVGGAYVEDVFFHRLVQHHGPGGRGHQRHTVFFEQREDGLGVGGAPVQEQGHDVFLFDQLTGVFSGQRGLEFVVHRDDFDLLATHATFGVDTVQVQHGPGRGLLDPRRHGPGKTAGLADQNLCLCRLAGGDHQHREGHRMCCLHFALEEWRNSSHSATAYKLTQQGFYLFGSFIPRPDSANFAARWPGNWQKCARPPLPPARTCAPVPAHGARRPVWRRWGAGCGH